MSDFVELQFIELRKEILGIKERIIKIQVLGVTGIPVIFMASRLKTDFNNIFMFLPLITSVIGLILIFEQNSLMRAGEYIKNTIEPILAPRNFIGWEEWLQAKKERRKAETFLSLSVHITFLFYYLIGLAPAYCTLKTEYGISIAKIGIGIYILIFFSAIYLIINNFATGTTTKSDTKSNK